CENALLVLGSNSNSRVAHLKRYPHPIPLLVDTSNGDDNFSLLGELDGIARHIHDYLLHPAAIADESIRHLGQNVDRQLEPFFMGPERERFHRFVQRLAKSKRS